MQLSLRDKTWFHDYLRYVHYLSAAQLYLKDNFFLRKPLEEKHIKDRVLGHWGTVPGLNFIYAHLNYLISKNRASVLLVVGPGHGAPGILANLFAEGTLEEFYPNLTRDEDGAGELLKGFSWPGKFPSHLYPGVPGSILEGGELGYSLSTAYGAALDNPDLIVACVVGDGEAETGPIATAWHCNKFLHPAESGAVLPILHVNGYKISNPTIYGTMSDAELTSLFHGFGYKVRIVSEMDENHEKMADALSWAYKEILAIQKWARSGKKIVRPAWPMIVLRSLKGWTGVHESAGKKIEGNFRSHGIPLEKCKHDAKEFALLKKWLESYRVCELIDERGQPKKEILNHVPIGDFRMGKNKHAFGGDVRKDLELPNPEDYAVPYLRTKPEPLQSNTTIAGKYLRDVFRKNAKAKNFRFFCPDETDSNKLGAIFEATKRAYLWPLKPYDEWMDPKGRVIEMLSEHTLQGMLEGYILTGRHGFFATYEAFAMIVASMADQYAKFVKQSKKIPWRKPISSFNYILTSLGWRQDHNGFSHQNPGFISTILEKHGDFCSVYFPPDANSFVVTLEDCLKRKNAVNVIVGGKRELPQWVSIKQAREQIKKGVLVWDWIDEEASDNPDVVLAAAGDYMTVEAMAAITVLRKFASDVRVRFVSVSEITSLGIGDERCPARLGTAEFERYFTKDCPIVFNFHGYPDVIKKLVWNHKAAQRFVIHGYMEEGTTTTPFDMHVLNRTSRFHLAMNVARLAAEKRPKLQAQAEKLIFYCQELLTKHQSYIREYDRDLPEVESWTWF